MRSRALSILAYAALIGCSEAPVSNEERSVREGTGEVRSLGRMAAEVTLPLPRAAGDAVALEVVSVDNPQQRAVTLRIMFEGGDAPPQIVALYPPDHPARIAVPLPAGATALKIELQDGGEPVVERIDIRLAPLPKSAS